MLAGRLASTFIVGVIATMTSLVETWLMGMLDDEGALMIALPGAVLGLFGGIAAAILPWGDKSWGARQAIRLLALGLLAGSVVALYLSDYPTCPASGPTIADCIGGGRKGVCMFAAGLLAEQAFLLVRASGRETIARGLRAALAWAAEKTTTKEDR